MPHEIVVVGRLAHHDTQQLAQLLWPFALAGSVSDPDAVWPDELRTHVVTGKRAKPLRGSKRLAQLDLLACGGALWVVRGRVAESLRALVPDGDLHLVPAPLCDADGYLDGDWWLLDVRAQHPLDRSSAELTSVPAGGPHASLIGSVDRLAWAADRSPSSPLFRVSEAPELLCAQRWVFDRLQEWLGPWVVALEPPYANAVHDGRPCARLSSMSLHRGHPGAPPLPHDEAVGLAAEAAYFRLAAGAANANDRERACRSPIYAYHLARCVDRAPADDTRAGALTHPRYATLYARDVDRCPRDDTRDAALEERLSAHHYLCEVERAHHPAFEPVLGAAAIRAMFEDVPALRASARPSSERFPPTWLSPEAANSSRTPARQGKGPG